MTPRHARPASIPTNRANSPTNGKPIGMPKPLQMFVSMLRITQLRRINDRGICGQSAAHVHFNVWMLKTLSPNSPHVGGDSQYERRGPTVESEDLFVVEDTHSVNGEIER